LNEIKPVGKIINNQIFFFDSQHMNWDDLFARKVVPPFVPTIVSGMRLCRSIMKP